MGASSIRATRSSWPPASGSSPVLTASAGSVGRINTASLRCFCCAAHVPTSQGWLACCRWPELDVVRQNDLRTWLPSQSAKLEHLLHRTADK